MKLEILLDLKIHMKLIKFSKWRPPLAYKMNFNF